MLAAARRTVRSPRRHGLWLVQYTLMTVMSCGLPEIRMDLSLLEMGVQLMTLSVTPFRTVNATITGFDQACGQTKVNKKNIKSADSLYNPYK